MADGKKPRDTLSDTVFGGRGGKPEPKLDGDEFTPITNLADLGPTLGYIKNTVQALEAIPADVTSIKATVSEMKPKVESLTEGIVELRTRARASEARLKRNEDKVSEIAERPHDCAQVEAIHGLVEAEKSIRKDASEITQRVVVSETTLSTAVKTIEKMDDAAAGRSRWLSGVMITVVLTVIGAAAGWLTTLSTLRSDVQHLSDEQSRIRSDMASVKSATRETGVKIEAATEVISQAAAKNDVPSEAVTLEELWCVLPAKERDNLRKTLPTERIPRRVCP